MFHKSNKKTTKIRIDISQNSNIFSYSEYYITEPDILNRTAIYDRSKNKRMIRYSTKKELSNNFLNYNTETTSKNSYKVLPKKNDSESKNEKQKNSFCTVSTNNSDSNVNKKNNENIKSNKFLIAQNKWKKNYFATFIQKVFRGYIFRKMYRNKSFMIYRKKKVKNQSKLRLSLKNKINDSQRPKIKTIIIKSFRRSTLLTNY